MKVLIIDDEPKARENLQTLIENYCDQLTIAGLAGSLEEGARLIDAHHPDLIFLDISMPGGSGFELLKQIPEINFEIIFVTAYDSYGIQAVKANALDYLLKPVSIRELKEAVQKALKKKDSRKTADIANLSSLLSGLAMPKSSHLNRISVPAADGLVIINTEEIVSLAADGSYTRLALRDGRKLLSSRNLKEYEDQLPPDIFMRVHHSHVINLSYVSHYHRGEGGSVSMTDGSHLLVSKRKKKEFLDRFS
jgi:two-component system LytT family response regulator